PRYVAIDATGGMGSWLNVPLRIERRYEDYEVEGGTPKPEGSTFRPAGTVRRRELDSIADPVRRKAVADSIEKARDECIDEATDRDRPDGVSRSEHRRQMRSEIRRCVRRDRDDSNLIVKIPEDSAALLTHPELGEPILAMGDLIDETELQSLGDALGALPKTPWTAQVQLPRGVSSLLQHARYNRVEALSLGASGKLDLGRLQVDGLARIGLADGVPNAELSVSRRSPNAAMALTGYRRLATANPETRPFGLVNSSTALFSQRDDGEYFRTLGVEWTAANTNSGWWSLRLYYERQRPAQVETSASLPHLFDGSKLFRPNFQADSATQAGASLTLRGTKAVSRTLTLGAEANLQGGTGDFDFGRSSVTLRAFLAPPGPLAGAMTVSAGTSTGEVPLQSRFYLGGPATLRGYDGGVLAGSAYWTGRIEVGNAFPAARITAFSDIGWAGDRDRFGDGKPLLAVGIGASFLDGLVRIDLARALRAPTGLRLDFYFDGIL
ncbi:MAG: BamA/TamA family outer membrane protein, partial [Gemmatimonadales bacterium]